MKKRQMDKINARIAKLTAELDLTPEQQAKLRQTLEAKLNGFESMFSGDGDPSQMNELSMLLSGNGTDQVLESLLTPEQKAAHEALKTRELANRVESKALKSLAKLSFLDLSQQQKDAAYAILYADAETTAETTSPENTMLSLMTDGMGIDLDFEDLGLSGALEMEESVASGERPDPAEVMARMKESRMQRVNEKVEALRPVLNETQLEAYRKNLESKSEGMLGGMFGGMEVRGLEAGDDE